MPLTNLIHEFSTVKTIFQQSNIAWIYVCIYVVTAFNFTDKMKLLNCMSTIFIYSK